MNSTVVAVDKLNSLYSTFSDGLLHPTARVTSYVLGFAVFLLALRNFQNRGGHKINSHLVPMPVSFPFHATVYLLTRSLWKGGGYFLWGHQRVIRDLSVGIADSKWLKQFRTSVVRIRAALWVRWSVPSPRALAQWT